MPLPTPLVTTPTPSPTPLPTPFVTTPTPAPTATPEQPSAADDEKAPAQTPPPREQMEPALVAIALFLGAMGILFLGSLYVLLRLLRRRRKKARRKGR